jgi:thiol:disulfide interchange protein
VIKLDKEVAVDEGRTSTQPNRFLLSTRKRTYIICAETSDSRESWINAIRLAVHKLGGAAPPSTANASAPSAPSAAQRNDATPQQKTTAPPAATHVNVKASATQAATASGSSSSSATEAQSEADAQAKENTERDATQAAAQAERSEEEAAARQRKKEKAAAKAAREAAAAAEKQAKQEAAWRAKAKEDVGVFFFALLLECSVALCSIFFLSVALSHVLSRGSFFLSIGLFSLFNQFL